MIEKWEYKVVEEHGIRYSGLTLNQLGEEGWELVSVVRDNPSYNYVFLVLKRYKED